MKSSIWIQLASVALLLVLWHATALAADSAFLPGPPAVFAALIHDIGTGELPYHVGVTLARVAVSFVIAMLIGTAVGFLMGRVKPLDRFFDSWLILFLNVPALVTIILAYVWFGLIEAAAVGAVALNKIPIVVVNVREGARALDRSYLEMADVFQLDPWRVLRHVVLPQLYPFLVAAARSGLALIWKIVLVVELLGRGNGVGFQLYLFFQLFDVTHILAYTIAFIIIIQVLELAILQPLERRATRWRL